MKRLLLSVLVIAPLMTNAQFTKGDKFLGGTFSFDSRKNPDDSYGGQTYNFNSFSLNPSMGFLVNEKFAMGGQIGYASSHYENINNSNPAFEANSKSFSTGIFAQRYFKISDKFLFSAIGLFNFSRGIDSTTSPDYLTGELNENKTHNYRLSTSVRPSFMFFPSPKWAFEASIGSISYSYLRDLSTDEKQNIFNINYGTVTFGVYCYFRKSAE